MSWNLWGEWGNWHPQKTRYLSLCVALLVSPCISAVCFLTLHADCLTVSLQMAHYDCPQGSPLVSKAWRMRILSYLCLSMLRVIARSLGVADS